MTFLYHKFMTKHSDIWSKNKNGKLNSSNKEFYSIPCSWNKLTYAIQDTKNSALGPDQINNAEIKHLPPKRLDILPILCNKI